MYDDVDLNRDINIKKPPRLPWALALLLILAGVAVFAIYYWNKKPLRTNPDKIQATFKTLLAKDGGWTNIHWKECKPAEETYQVDAFHKVGKTAYVFSVFRHKSIKNFVLVSGLTDKEQFATYSDEKTSENIPDEERDGVRSLAAEIWEAFLQSL